MTDHYHFLWLARVRSSFLHGGYLCWFSELPGSASGIPASDAVPDALPLSQTCHVTRMWVAAKINHLHPNLQNWETTSNISGLGYWNRNIRFILSLMHCLGRFWGHFNHESILMAAPAQWCLNHCFLYLFGLCPISPSFTFQQLLTRGCEQGTVFPGN